MLLRLNCDVEPFVCAFLEFARLSERCISAPPCHQIHDRSVQVSFGKLMENVDPPSVLLIRRADVEYAPSALVLRRSL
jgi:hypothetical protein